MLLYLCIKILQIPDATEDAFYLYLKETFGGYFGVITFLEEYFRLFQIFTVLAVIISFTILVSDFFGKIVLRKRIHRLEAEVNALKAKLYDKKEVVVRKPEEKPFKPDPSSEKWKI